MNSLEQEAGEEQEEGQGGEQEQPQEWDKPEPWMLASLTFKPRETSKKGEEQKKMKGRFDEIAPEEEQLECPPCGEMYQLGRTDHEETTQVRQVYSLNARYKDFKPVQVVVDSAAVDAVMCKGTIEELRGPNAGPLKKGEAALQGINYVTADGGEVPNEGEQGVNVLTREGHVCDMTWQVADIQKPLLAVAALTRTGHEVRFRANGG